MRCPGCNNKVIQRSGREIKIRTKGKHVIDEDNRYWAQCFWCGKDVQLPLQITEGTQIPSEAFYVKGKKPNS
jgi:hypothetical protein